MIDVSQLRIDGAVFHQVPARSQTGPDDEPLKPVLSTVESSLDTQLEFFLRDRLMRTFSEAAQPVAEDPEQECPTPDIVKVALESGPDPDIVDPFHPLPSLLHTVQAHNSPEGLLAIIRGSCGAIPVIVIVKVEQERGLSFDTVEEDGQVRVEVVFEDGLVLTDKTEVFKAAVFYSEDDDLVGLLTDDQSGNAYRGPSSQYWLRAFLGCELTNYSDELTRSWIKATKRLIKSDLADPSEKDAVLTAMHAELGSNRANIAPRKFIEDYVPQHAQDQALTRLREEGAPRTSFPKSRDVSAKAPKKKKIVFDGGVEVRMPSDATPNLSSEMVEDQRVDVLTIRGRISRVDDS